MGLVAQGQESEVRPAGVPRVHLVGSSDQIVQCAPILPEQPEEQPKAEQEEAERQGERPGGGSATGERITADHLNFEPEERFARRSADHRQWHREVEKGPDDEGDARGDAVLGRDPGAAEDHLHPEGKQPLPEDEQHAEEEPVEGEGEDTADGAGRRPLQLEVASPR